MPVDPQALQVVHYPAPILRRKAAPIDEITDEVRAVALRMVDLMREQEGIGLAAPQVGLPWRMFVVHVPEAEGRSASAVPPTASTGPRIYVNPMLTEPRGSLEPYEEGCLSLPDVRGELLRPAFITLTASDLDGAWTTQTAGGLLARCWQHENDHLDGVLIIDKFTQLSRLKNRSAVRELERNAGL